MPIHVWATWAALLLLVAVASVLSGAFLTKVNLLNIMTQSSIIAIIGVGMTFVIVTGGIDLSVGSMVALASVLMALALGKGAGLAASVSLGMAVGMLGGVIQGAGIAVFRIPPFIMTLAGMTVFRGIARIVSECRPISLPYEMEDPVARIAEAKVFGEIPLPILYMFAVYFAGYILLRHTHWGAYTLAVGGNEEAARLSGIGVRRVKTLVYALSGLCAGLAAIVGVARVGGGEPTAGLLFELDAIASVVIGGTVLTGGKGGLSGTLAGALLLQVLLNLFNLTGVPSAYQEVFKGLIIVAAVLMQFKKQH